MADLRIVSAEPEPGPREDNPFDRGRMYDVGQVCEILAISRATLYRKINAGAIPRPLKFRAIGQRWPGHRLVQWWDRAADEAEARAPAEDQS